jgi:hypothetical protein
MDPTDSTFFQPQQFQPQNGVRAILRFFTDAEEMTGESLAAGRSIYRDADFVGITNPGSRDEFVKRCTKLTDPYHKQAYAQWKTTQQQPVDGTPLTQVPWLSQSQIKELNAINIMSLEHLAEMSDATIQRVGMGGNDLRKKAQTYIKAATDTALVMRLETELQSRDRDIERLTKEIQSISARFDAAAKEKAA